MKETIKVQGAVGLTIAHLFSVVDAFRKGFADQIVRSSISILRAKFTQSYKFIRLPRCAHQPSFLLSFCEGRSLICNLHGGA